MTVSGSFVAAWRKMQSQPQKWSAAVRASVTVKKCSDRALAVLT